MFGDLKWLVRNIQTLFKKAKFLSNISSSYTVKHPWWDMAFTGDAYTLLLVKCPETQSRKKVLLFKYLLSGDIAVRMGSIMP